MAFMVVQAAFGATSTLNSDTIFTKLVSSSASVGHGEAIFEITNPDSIMKLDLADLSFEFLKGTRPITDYYLYLKENQSYQSPVYEDKITSKTCNITKTCNTIITSVKSYETKYRTIWTPIKGKLELSKGTYQIKLVAYWKPSLGVQNIDWVPTLDLKSAKYSLGKDLKITKSEWSWWNTSYTHKRYLNCTNMTATVPFVINGSAGFYLDSDDKQIVWTYCRGNTTALYYNTISAYAIANATRELPMEVEMGNGTSYNASSVWTPQGYITVLHMRDRNDTMSATPWTSGTPPTSVANGMIGNGYLFDGDGINMSRAYGGLGTDYSLISFYNDSGKTPAAYGNVFMMQPKDIDWGVMIDHVNTELVLRWGSCYADGIEWSHVGKRMFVASQNSADSTAKLYINSTETKSYSCSNNDALAKTYFAVGFGDRSARQFNGLIDEIRISNNSMSATTVKEMWNNYLGIKGFGTLSTTYTNYTAPGGNPNVTKPVWNSTKIYTDIPVTISTNYTNDGKFNGTVYFICLKNGVGLLNHTDSNILPNATTSLNIGSGNYTALDNLNCSVRAFDGYVNSSTYWSDVLTISNYVPSITTPAWNESILKNTHPINLSTIYTDADSHLGELNFSCFKNSISLINFTQGSIATGSTVKIQLGASNYTLGDYLNCSVVGSDGYNATSTLWSSTLQVLNNNPSVTTPQFNRTSINATENIACNSTYTDLDSTGWIYFSFYVNGISTYSYNFSGLNSGNRGVINISETNYTTNDYINCSVYGGDTYNTTSTKWSSTIQVGYIPPIPPDFGVASPRDDWVYRSSIVLVNITGAITNPDLCWYRIDNQDNTTFECTILDFNLEFPINLGNTTLDIFMQNTTSTYLVTRNFSINNDFLSGKGYLLVGLLALFLILPFIFLYYGFKMDSSHIAFKLFITLLGMSCVYIFLHLGRVVSEEFIHLISVTDIFDIVTLVYGYILVAIISYYLLSILYTLLYNLVKFRKFSLNTLTGGNNGK
jgi:hypothetical protein